MFDLEEIRKRCEKATPGPWTDGGQGWVFGPNREPVPGAQPGELEDLVASAHNQEDVDFIVHARTDIPALLHYIEHLEGEIHYYTGQGRWPGEF